MAPLRTLAEVVEPVKDYGREAVRHYDSFSPYNRLVDLMPGSGEAARRFAELVDNMKPEDIPKIREWLTLWRDNDARLEPVLARSAPLAENAEISKDLSAIAAVGLQALDGNHSAEWVKRQEALLDRAKRAHGELLLSVEPPIRKLIETAR